MAAQKFGDGHQAKLSTSEKSRRDRLGRHVRSCEVFNIRGSSVQIN